MNPEDPARVRCPMAQLGWNARDRCVQIAAPPLSADDAGEFCPVCLLRSALDETTAADEDSEAEFSEFEHFELQPVSNRQAHSRALLTERPAFPGNFSNLFHKT